MKKKVFSLLAVVLFMGSSFGNASIANTKYIEEDEFGACGLYAEYMANLFVENGLNYYEGYFGGYARCLEILGASGI